MNLHPTRLCFLTDDRAEEAEAANRSPWASPSHEHQPPAACLRDLGLRSTSACTPDSVPRVRHRGTPKKKEKSVSSSSSKLFKVDIWLNTLGRHTGNNTCLWRESYLSMLLMVCVCVGAVLHQTPLGMKPVLSAQEMRKHWLQLYCPECLSALYHTDKHAKVQPLFLSEYSSGLVLGFKSSVLHQQTQVTCGFEVLFWTLQHII